MQAPYKIFTSRHFRALDLYHPDCIKDLIGAFPMYLTLSWTRKERERERAIVYQNFGNFGNGNYVLVS